jgi:hypothetical protein
MNKYDLLIRENFLIFQFNIALYKYLEFIFIIHIAGNYKYMIY